MSVRACFCRFQVGLCVCVHVLAFNLDYHSHRRGRPEAAAMAAAEPYSVMSPQHQKSKNKTAYVFYGECRGEKVPHEGLEEDWSDLEMRNADRRQHEAQVVGLLLVRNRADEV